MKVLHTIKSQPTSDGAGVKISRVADFAGRILDPFLMIDELKSDDKNDYMAGFPPHPHRGLETFTYMIKGGFEHEDQMGNKKVINDGNVQWMSTGFGVVHSEMPVADDIEGMHGFQIWVNMAAKDKLRTPVYQDSTETGLPVVANQNGASLKALAGIWHLGEQQASSPLDRLSADAGIADITLAPGADAEIEVNERKLVAVYIHSGELNGYPARTMLVVDPSQPIVLKASDGGAGALIFKGNPLNEPIAHMGPFVMNHQHELQQAVMDYQTGKFGTI